MKKNTILIPIMFLLLQVCGCSDYTQVSTPDAFFQPDSAAPPAGSTCSSNNSCLTPGEVCSVSLGDCQAPPGMPRVQLLQRLMCHGLAIGACG
jgi:hypothetical protein